jgi:hypothetical protein
MFTRKLVVYGASGHGLAIGSHAEHAYAVSPLYEVVAYIDDFVGDTGNTLDGRPIIKFETWEKEYRHIPIIVSVGDPSARKMMTQRVQASGGEFASLFVPNAAFPGISRKGRVA